MHAIWSCANADGKIPSDTKEQQDQKINKWKAGRDSIGQIQRMYKCNIQNFCAKIPSIYMSKAETSRGELDSLASSNTTTARVLCQTALLFLGITETSRDRGEWGEEKLQEENPKAREEHMLQSSSMLLRIFCLDHALEGSGFILTLEAVEGLAAGALPCW